MEQTEIEHSQKVLMNNQKKWVYKTLIIITLALILLIPSGIINNMIQERAERQHEVMQKVAQSWAGEQRVEGPYLRFKTKEIDNDGKVIFGDSYIYPQKLDVKVKIHTEERQLGIYKVPVYTAQLTIKGRFSALNKINKSILPEHANLAEAMIFLGVSDIKGFTENCEINWLGQNIPMMPDENFTNDLSCVTNLKDVLSEEIPFEINISIRGTEQLMITPLAGQTTVWMESNWKSPGYIGKFLPNTPDTSADGFKASWSIPKSAVPFQHSRYKSYELCDKYAFGVKMVQPVSHYTSSERSVKYALLIIALTFLSFVMIETRRGNLIHPLHYGLVGLALVLFYSLLVSISEFSAFGVAYFVSALMTTLLISLFTRAVLKENKPSMGVAVILSGLYAFVYFIVLQEDYALLFGNIGLFVILASVMYLSRNMQWNKL